MISREQLEEQLKHNKPFLKEKYHVEKIGYFGSFARGEQNENSDVDILVELDKPIGWDLIELQEYLEVVLKSKVDLVTTKALRTQLKEQIFQEVLFQ